MIRFRNSFRFLRWRITHLTPRQTMVVFALLIGLLTGSAAVLLKNIVHFTSHWLSSSFNSQNANFLYLAFPFTGILLTVLYIKFFIKDNIGHGISRVLWSISKNKGKIKSHNMFSSIISSTLTVGFGGSVGLEAPVVYTGSAIGSNLSRWFQLNYKMTVLLIGCGATGAIAGIFKAPIAATIFALEVLMIDLSSWTLIPLLISAASGSMVSYFLMGKDAEFSFTLHDPLNLKNIPFYIVLGIFCGLAGVYFTRGIARTEYLMKKIKNDYVKVLVGGLLLSLFVFFLPPLFGEGYLSLKDILGGNPSNLANGSLFYSVKDHIWFFPLFCVLILLLKVVAVGVTTGSGGVGGVFAPSLFMGGIMGFLFSKVLNNFHFFHYLSERNFALVGMAGLMAAIMHAPLTSIFLIAELTTSYDLFIPLILTTSMGYLTHRIFEPYSIYTRRLAQNGELITHHKDKAVLTLLRIHDVIEKDIQTIQYEGNMGDLVKIITKSKRNIFPVTQADGRFMGIVNFDDIRDIVFHQELYHTVLISTLTAYPDTVVFADDPMIKVMEKFEKSKMWNLPVVNDKGQYMGMLSKARVLSFYREKMVETSEE